MQHAERAKRLRQLKQKTQCSACGRYGHWAGDPECARQKDGQQKKTAYFTVGGEVQTGQTEISSQCFMLQQAKKKSSMKTFLTEPCAHIWSQAIQRGANGWQRHLQCAICQAFLCQVPRVQSWDKGRRTCGLGLWQYLMISLLCHADGAPSEISGWCQTPRKNQKGR